MGFVIRVEQTAVAYTYESWEEMLFHGEGLSTGVFDRVGFTLCHRAIWVPLLPCFGWCVWWFLCLVFFAVLLFCTWVPRSFANSCIGSLTSKSFFDRQCLELVRLQRKKRIYTGWNATCADDTLHWLWIG